MTEAVKTAGSHRLRPILMTTMSTVFGVLPIALGLGAGAESRKPLGAVVVSGMLFSMFFTLIVVPVVYTLLARFGGEPVRKPAAEAAPAALPATESPKPA